jgi:hypothetical protein
MVFRTFEHLSYALVLEITDVVPSATGSPTRADLNRHGARGASRPGCGSRLAPGLGSRAARQLLKAFGLPAAILEQDLATLTQVVAQGPPSALRREPPHFEQHIDRHAAWLQQDTAQRALVTLGDAGVTPPCWQIERPAAAAVPAWAGPLARGHASRWHGRQPQPDRQGLQKRAPVRARAGRTRA